MIKQLHCSITGILLPLLLVSGASRTLRADESDFDLEPYRVHVEGASVDDADSLQLASETEFDEPVFFVQQGTTEAPAAVAPRTSSRNNDSAAARRRRNTYRLPNMFGDFPGAGLLRAIVTGNPMNIPQSIRDGVGGVDLFVQNTNGGAGADPNPAVTIQVLNGGVGGNLVATSTGPGVSLGSIVDYPISDPTTTGFSQPMVNGPGTLDYNGGIASGFVNDGENWVLNFSHTFTPTQVDIPVPSGGAAVRRLKIAENNSPLPRDRFIANYNFFNDVFGGIGDVNRYAFGFERTMNSGSSSIQVLFPFASTLDSNQFVGAGIAKGTEFGDISLVYKRLLIDSDDCALAAGLGLTVPTGSDASVFNMTGDEIIHINHTSVHLLPYLALLRGYDSGWYCQSFLQMDIDLNGNGVDADLTGANLMPVGSLQEQTLLFADVGVGYQFNQLDDGSPAVAATAELHYATTLQDSDEISAGALTIQNFTNRFDVVNLTLGLNVRTNRGFSIRPAMVIPLSTGDDELFDYEAMVQMNYWR